MIYTVNKEFDALLPPLSDDQLNRLEESILEVGCMDAIKIWKQTNEIVDGHNRFNICSKHDLEFDVQFLDFDNIEQAKYWMILNQSTRRNLSNPFKLQAACYIHDFLTTWRKANTTAGEIAPVPKNALEERLVDEIKGADGEIVLIAGNAVGIGKESVRQSLHIFRSDNKQLIEDFLTEKTSIKKAYEIARAEEIQNFKDDKKAAKPDARGVVGRSQKADDVYPEEPTGDNDPPPKPPTTTKPTPKAKTKEPTEDSPEFDHSLSELKDPYATMVVDLVASRNNFLDMCEQTPSEPNREAGWLQIRMETVDGLFSALVREIEGLTPETTCTHCDGEGCNDCHQTGFIPKGHA